MERSRSIKRMDSHWDWELVSFERSVSFPRFFSWSSGRKRVALATVSDSRPLHEIVPTDAMAFASYGGDNMARWHIRANTRYSVARVRNILIIREFRRMRNARAWLIHVLFLVGSSFNHVLTAINITFHFVNNVRFFGTTDTYFLH